VEHCIAYHMRDFLYHMNEKFIFAIDKNYLIGGKSQLCVSNAIIENQLEKIIKLTRRLISLLFFENYKIMKHFSITSKNVVEN
jgi:hypothetical protein